LRALLLARELGLRAVFPELLQEIAPVAASPVEGARLLSASERLCAELGMPRWDPSGYEQTAASMRTELGERGFSEPWAAGAALAEDEALALAAACLD
jgi:hypothetical protein